jgi:hypothetical protein
MARACWILLFGLIYGTAQGQPGFQISGRVVDTAGAALSFATVQLIVEKDSSVTMTRDDGRFIIRHQKIKAFSIYVTMKGYLPFTRSFALGEDKSSVQLGEIMLHANYNELDPVIVSRVRPITIGDDTISYHAAAFPVRDGADVEDILKRLPGVEVDIDGNVIVQGKKIEKVLVNGKEFFGGDVLLAIQNLPADAVDKLQVIDDYGDKARLTGVRSGDAAKILNIVLKADKSNGQFARGQAGAGNSGKYLIDGFANTFKGERQVSATASASNNSPTGSNYIRNGGLNYADQWNRHWAGGINVNTGATDSRSEGSTNQDSYYPGAQLQQKQISQANSNSANSGLTGALTYKPDGWSSLRLTPSLSFQHSLNEVADTFSTSQQDSGFSKSTTGTSQASTRSNTRSAGADLYFENLSPHSRRRFSAQGAVHYSDNQAANDNLTNTTIMTDSLSSSVTHFLVSNKNPSWNMNASANYYLPTGAASFLDLGYIHQSALTRSDLLSQQPKNTGIGWTPVDSLSQATIFRTFFQQVHSGYSAHAGKFNITLGLDLQLGLQQGTADAKGDLATYRYFSLLPLAQAAWSLTPTRRISFNYRGSPSLPSLQQVSPITDLTNPQYPVTGNPGLKPSYTQTFFLHYEESALQPTQFHGFGVGLGYTATQDPIIPYTIHPEDSTGVVQQTTYVNTGSSSAFNANYHFTLPTLLNKHFRITANGNLNQSRNTTMTDGLRYTNTTLTWNQSLHLQLLIPDIIETDISGNYSVSHATYPGSTSLPNTFQTAAITLNGKHYLSGHWIFTYRFSQSYTSSGNKFKSAPSFLTGAIKREFLPHNKATISLAGYNLFNSTAGINQSASATGVTQTQTAFTPRYFLISLQLKLGRLSR